MAYTTQNNPAFYAPGNAALALPGPRVKRYPWPVWGNPFKGKARAAYAAGLSAGWAAGWEGRFDWPNPYPVGHRLRPVWAAGKAKGVAAHANPEGAVAAHCAQFGNPHADAGYCARAAGVPAYAASPTGGPGISGPWANGYATKCRAIERKASAQKEAV